MPFKGDREEVPLVGMVTPQPLLLPVRTRGTPALMLGMVSSCRGCAWSRALGLSYPPGHVSSSCSLTFDDTFPDGSWAPVRLVAVRATCGLWRQSSFASRVVVTVARVPSVFMALYTQESSKQLSNAVDSLPERKSKMHVNPKPDCFPVLCNFMVPIMDFLNAEGK